MFQNVHCFTYIFHVFSTLFTTPHRSPVSNRTQRSQPCTHAEISMAATALLTGSAITGGTVEPTLIIHLDVNKTIIMLDPASKVDMHHIVNSLIAVSAWGPCVEAAGDTAATWALGSNELSSMPPEASWISYDTFLRDKLNVYMVAPKDMKDDERTALHEFNLKQRTTNKTFVRHFTDAGHPGAVFADFHQSVMKRLTRTASERPESGATAAKHTGNLSAQQQVFLLPSYFSLLEWLARNHTGPFLVCLRTFGSDIPACMQEHNAWIRGEHPHVRTPENVDLTPLLLHGPHDTAAAVRTGVASRDTRLAVVLTPLHHTPTQAGSSVDSECAGVGFVTGYRDIHDFVASKAPATTCRHPFGAHGGSDGVDSTMSAAPVRRVANGRCFAIRDDWEWWFSHSEQGEYGKLLPLDPDDTAHHHIFFDDNIGRDSDSLRLLTTSCFEGLDAGEAVVSNVVGAEPELSLPDSLPIAADAGIVDVRNVHTSAPIPFQQTRNVHLVRADPLSAILNPQYYVQAVQLVHQRWRDIHGLAKSV